MPAQPVQTIDSKATVRMDWMDELRGVAIILVILHHVLTIPAVLGGSPPQWQPIMGGLEPFRMPLMLVLSGLLLPRSIEKRLAVYYMGKIRMVLWPFLLWTVITNLVLLHVSVLADPWTWISGSWHLWFLAVLLACYLVGPLTRWVPAWAWVIPMVALSPFPDTNAYVRILWFGSFFFFGAALARWVPRWQAARPVAPIAMLVAMGAFAVWVASPFGEYRQATALSFVASLLGVLAIVWVAPRVRRAQWLQYVGKQSMVFYLAHFPTIGVTYLLIGDQSWWVLFPVLALVGYGIPSALTFVSKAPLFELPRYRPASST